MKRAWKILLQSASLLAIFGFVFMHDSLGKLIKQDGSNTKNTKGGFSLFSPDQAHADTVSATTGGTGGGDGGGSDSSESSDSGGGGGGGGSGDDC